MNIKQLRTGNPPDRPDDQVLERLLEDSYDSKDLDRLRPVFEYLQSVNSEQPRPSA